MKGPASLPWPSKTIQEFVQDYLPRSTHFFFKYLVKIESVQISGIFQDKALITSILRNKPLRCRDLKFSILRPLQISKTSDFQCGMTIFVILAKIEAISASNKKFYMSFLRNEFKKNFEGFSTMTLLKKDNFYLWSNEQIF